MFDVDTYRRLLKDEVIQRGEEGCAVDGMARRAEGVASAAEGESLYAELQALVSPFEADEPSTIDGIERVKPGGAPPTAHGLDRARLRDKILGGWRGRVAGCQLGKPVENWRFEAIERYLKGAGVHPLDFYFPGESVDEHGKSWRVGLQACTRERLDHATRDDDQDYTILGLHLLERHGPGFTTSQVGERWLELLPYWQVYTAEREAYRNLVEGCREPETATRWNPYREWIGAQIRADGFGYASPGAPSRAAELAFRDAALSHVKNGIYGEMFMAAAIAAAFVTDDVRECLARAVAEIPARSRLARVHADCLDWRGRFADWEDARRACDEKYGRYHSVHTLNNAALVILALLYGERDYGRTVCYAVAGGWDTDCNGATAGSILGVMLGAAELPAKWVDPLNDRLQSAVFGFADSRITELAERTLAVASTS